MISYKRVKILCDGTQNGGASWDHKAIVEPGTLVPDVGILFLSAILRFDGANQGQATLRLGGGADEIPLYTVGQNFHLTPPDNEGVFFSCPVLAAGTYVDFLIGFSVTGTAQQ